MENHNPNIPPLFGNIEQRHPHIPSYSSCRPHYYYYYQNHHYQYYQQYEQYFQPQYQQHFVPPQLPQSQIVRGSYSTTAIDSYNAVIPSPFFPSADAQNHSYIPSYALPETFPKDDTTKFWNIVGESIGWKISNNGVGPFYDFVIREGSKRRNGWCRDLAGISTSRLDNSQTLQYFDLLLKCNAPSFAGSKIMDHFYYAFDMDRCSLNHVMLPQSSILKRTSSSQPTTAATRASARGPNSSSLLQNSSASKRNKHSKPLKTAQTPIQKAPEYVSTAISKLDDDLDLARNTSRNTYDNFAFDYQRNANSNNNNNDDMMMTKKKKKKLQLELR
ncbi:hypothetical protein FRACYDRAFT_246760 [Fragilariopsis cylindrus CCMP1102]|uniref:Uncharacterized protein n=1 Tax=Fragilariopsis cylindrus CCMP1102 TaxID=635003 RepID=A0A1E7EYK2_9STRA|nr:hypothetical protein FRACYDRAFT_246760 [Fragilariopsis cylindrus CCMP1102]|eukprot:OEU10885.1 hypothetical protein FRACYDRAFT_246760 [Fragilariopsis cylindrus CCMP1102]